MKPTITENLYGEVYEQPIIQYRLFNPNGMQVNILNLGGTITDIITPDIKGNYSNVILGYDSLAGYLQQNNPYFNCLIGRYGNRIAKGRFDLEGRTYVLAQNNNGHSLHGGTRGFDKVLWDVQPLPEDNSLQLTYLSKNGEEGYPGNLKLTVVYTLTATNELKIEYTATTDEATPVNLTSHCYFNLSGGVEPTILDHHLQIFADLFTEVDESLIPTGNLAAVKNTPMDFTLPKRIGQDITSVQGGYDHNWVIRKTTDQLSKAAFVMDEKSERTLEVWTSQPGIQFYSGNFLDGTLLHTRNGTNYSRHAALCLETQHYPDSPNHASFPNTILRPGEIYRQQTIYKFAIR